MLNTLRIIFIVSSVQCNYVTILTNVKAVEAGISTKAIYPACLPRSDLADYIDKVS